MIAPVYVHMGNAETGEVDAAGPFDFVQITYNSFVRVQNAGEYDDDLAIATYHEHPARWIWDDGSEWTDLTISTTPRTDA